MLRELAKLSSGMLFLGGHITNVETARLLDRGNAPTSGARPRPAKAIPQGSRTGTAEMLALALVWITTPALVLLMIADLVRSL